MDPLWGAVRDRTHLVGVACTECIAGLLGGDDGGLGAVDCPPAAEWALAGRRHASNGSSSSLVTVGPDGDEYRASSANEVGSVPNCTPQWLHPPERTSRRLRSSARSRHRARRCLSEPVIGLFILSFALYPRTSWAPNRLGAFGELRSLPYYCSTAGQHTHRWAKVYEVGNHAPNR